jgi:glycosyltransferase involved in cell wall biosynthesis
MSLPSIAVLVPCHNEQASIAKVVADFRAALPDATVYVYDNNSTDRTVELALAAGARVFHEPLQGKGNVVRRMFADIEADVYVLVDGDDTYLAASARAMVERLLDERLDMMNGTRVTEIVAAYRRGHRLGNTVLSGMVRKMFGSRIADMLSGYRVFSRRFVKSFPVMSSGFEIETELTIHALELAMPVGEVDTPYKDRPEGSASKLRTYSDGLRILRTIILLIKDERPLLFFAIAGMAFFVTGIVLSFPIFVEYHRMHLVPRLPTAVLSLGLVLLSFLSLVCGMVLDSVARGRKEFKRLAYLSLPVWQGLPGSPDNRLS